MKRRPSKGFMTTATAPLSLANFIMPTAEGMSVRGSTLAQRRRSPPCFQTSAIQWFQLLVSATSTSGRSVIPLIQRVLWSTWMSIPNASMCLSLRLTSSISRDSAAVLRSRPARWESAWSCCSLSVGRRSPTILPSMTHCWRVGSSGEEKSLGRNFSSDLSR